MLYQRYGFLGKSILFCFLFFGFLGIVLGSSGEDVTTLQHCRTIPAWIALEVERKVIEEFSHAMQPHAALREPKAKEDLIILNNESAQHTAPADVLTPGEVKYYVFALWLKEWTSVYTRNNELVTTKTCKTRYVVSVKENDQIRIEKFRSERIR